MRVVPAATAIAVLFVLSTAGLFLAGASASAVAPSFAAPVTGNISGPAALAVNGSHIYYINATGGPGVSSSGQIVGTLEWNASVVAGNLTGVTVSPSTGTFTTGKAANTTLTVGNVTQPVRIVVRIDSILGSANVSTNLSYTVQVVHPYVLWATLVVSPSVGPPLEVLPLTLAVDLDGTPVGKISVPLLRANESYNLTFYYASTGLSAGYHTFTISLPNQHLPVRFADGATVYSVTFYVTGPPPNYTVWYLVGVVAFFGTLFILATRVAARRRGTARR
jgi:hypothetical protein